jgi:hypothetical protein
MVIGNLDASTNGVLCQVSGLLLLLPLKLKQIKKNCSDLVMGCKLLASTNPGL